MGNRSSLAAAFAAVVLLLATAGVAEAQSSFFDKAKSVLGGATGALPGAAGDASALTDGEIGKGLREALRVGTERVVSRLGKADGFNADPEIHIPLPDTLRSVQSVLKRVGMSSMADDLEIRLNRAAEAAAPKAKQLFWTAISEMTLDDVRRIYDGPKDAATRYFQAKMTPPLAEAMAPVVDKSLAEVGAIRSYDAMMSRYKALPFVPDVKADLTKYVVEKGMDGIFHYVAKEEAAIRSNPAARTTAILQRVFGGT